MAKIPYFPFYPDDYLSSPKVMKMTDAQKGVYITLLCLSWKHPGCKLPNDIDTIMLMCPRSKKANVEYVLRECFDASSFEGGGCHLSNGRLSHEHRKALLKSEKARESVKCRENKRLQESNDHRTIIERSSNQNQNQNQNQKELKTRAKNKKPLTPMPENFGLSDEVKSWALKRGLGNLEEHLESFKLKAVSKEYRYADWDAALKNAIRDDWAKIRGGGNGNGKSLGNNTSNVERAEPGKYAAALAGKTQVIPE